ncbi:MAG: thioredoxin fold domain-containing protein [Planctomycetales bacterium]|nr:thioredoxin fold domain-containing protein [Planctomycetales bacterium]
MRSRLVCTAGGLAVLIMGATALWAADDPLPADDAQQAAQAVADSEPSTPAEPAESAAADELASETQPVDECPADTAAREQAAADSLAADKAPAPRPLRHGVFRWTSYPAAWTAAQKTNRPILMFITSPGCPHCVKMISETYQAPHLSPLIAESFETVYIDRAAQPELVAKLKVRWFPTTIVVGTNNKVIDVLEGYVDPLAFTQRLKTGLAASTPETQTR